MKNKILAIGTIALALTATSCRESSDTLYAYDHEDIISFGEGYRSFGGKYKIAWKALNQYYALWDYEQQNGLDWDAAYDKYYPQFAALDQREADDPVTDGELKKLMDAAFGGLHDGHLGIEFLNHHNNNAPVRVSPSTLRNLDRDDAMISQKYQPNISKYYTLPANGEVEVDDKGQPLTAYYSTEVSALFGHFMNTKGIGYMWICDQIDKLSELTLPTAEQLEKLQALQTLKEKLSDENLNRKVLPFAMLSLKATSPISTSASSQSLLT